MCKGENIIVLQETNWKDEVMEDLKKRWNGEVVYNNGDGRKGGGVANLIDNYMNDKWNVVFDDRNGKCLALEISSEEETFVLCNVHAPTEEKEKRGLFIVLRSFTEKCKKVILLGDFNTVFSKLDMAEGMVYRTDTARKELNVLMEENDLIDIWRVRNEKRREYSRRQLVENFLCQTRIDYVLNASILEHYIEKV